MRREQATRHGYTHTQEGEKGGPPCARGEKFHRSTKTGRATTPGGDTIPARCCLARARCVACEWRAGGRWLTFDSFGAVRRRPCRNYWMDVFSCGRHPMKDPSGDFQMYDRTTRHLQVYIYVVSCTRGWTYAMSCFHSVSCVDPARMEGVFLWCV